MKIKIKLKTLHNIFIGLAMALIFVLIGIIGGMDAERIPLVGGFTAGIGVCGLIACCAWAAEVTDDD